MEDKTTTGDIRDLDSERKSSSSARNEVKRTLKEKKEHISPLSLASNNMMESCLGGKCGWFVNGAKRCAIQVIGVHFYRKP